MTIGGVRLLPLVPRRDCRGSLTEVFRTAWVDAPCVQWNLQRSSTDVRLRDARARLASAT